VSPYVGLFNFELVPERDMHDALLEAIAEGDAVYTVESDEAYIQLQRILLTSLRRYWVPRYLIHLLNYLPKDVLVILKRECPGDIGLLTQQRKRRCRMTFPRIYSAKPSNDSTPNAASTHATPSAQTPGSQAAKSSTETESDVTLPLHEVPEECEETNTEANEEGEGKIYENEANIQPEDLLSLWGGKTH